MTVCFGRRQSGLALPQLRPPGQRAGNHGRQGGIRRHQSQRHQIPVRGGQGDRRIQMQPLRESCPGDAFGTHGALDCLFGLPGLDARP